MRELLLTTGINHQLAKRIQTLRMERGWSQEVLAELASLHRNTSG